MRRQHIGQWAVCLTPKLTVCALGYIIAVHELYELAPGIGLIPGQRTLKIAAIAIFCN